MANISKVELNGTTYNIKTSGSIPTSEKGASNGVASLDSTGKVPSSQLPSYVDDVLEYSAKSSFPTTGETGKIYVDTSTNKTYRWSGSAYVEISESLALGETSSTAYRGDRGKGAYDHSQTTSGNPHNVTKSDVGLGNVGNFKAVSTVASQGLSNTEKSNARANIGAGTGNGTYSKPSGGIPKSDLATAVQTSLNQVATNQTNILYSLNTGVKNVLPIKFSDRTVYGVTLINNNDGSIRVNGTNLQSSGTILLANIQSDIYTDGYSDLSNFLGKNKDYVLVGNTTTANLKIQVLGWNSSSYNSIIASSSTDAVSFNTSTWNYIAIRLWAAASAAFSNVTITPMICTADAWAQSHDYQPPALPNYDLTRLQAEDRAALQCDVKYAKVPVSTSYSLIGSIKTKANRVCRITVTQEYSSVAPTGLILSKSNQSSDFNTLTNKIAPPVETTTDNLTLTISTLCHYTYDRVVYIWAKAKTASTNGNNFMALCEHFGDIDGVKTSMS